MLERGRLVAESVMQIERTEIAGPDYYPSDLVLQQGSHETGLPWSGPEGQGSTPATQACRVGRSVQAVLRAPVLLRGVLRGVAEENPARSLRAETYRARHRFGPGTAWLYKTGLSTNPIESPCSLVRHRERNGTRTRGSALLQRWLDGKKLCKCVNGCAGMAEVLAPIEAEHAEP